MHVAGVNVGINLHSLLKLDEAFAPLPSLPGYTTSENMQVLSRSCHHLCWLSVHVCGPCSMAVAVCGVGLVSQDTLDLGPKGRSQI